jgi:uncharacterized circularly permuted ATP-grasp superfamily protein
MNGGMPLPVDVRQAGSGQAYVLDPRFYDEAFQASGAPRPEYAAALALLEPGRLSQLSDSVARAVRARGARFGARSGVVPFRVDPVPRIFTAREWEGLEAGLVQRVRALNLFAADVYSDRRIVAAGRVPARVVDDAPYYERTLVGVPVPGGVYAGVAGLDVVRDRSGRLAVLEDNTRTPSGIAYAEAALQVIDECLGLDGDRARAMEPAWERFADALRAAAPDGRGDPSIALLTDGPRNSAWWEHQQIARRLSIPLLMLQDLEPRAGRLYARHGVDRRPIDVLYRRTDADRATERSGRPSPLGAALVEPIRSGRLACVNALGSGVCDDKLAHAYVEEMVRFYLDEEPLLPSVRTYDLCEPDQRAECLERLDRMVVKPRVGHGGHGVIVCAHATPTDRERAARMISRAPERHVAQELVQFSRHPTVQAGALAPRHVDLRPFVLSGRDWASVVPGGLTRVALEPDALVVNSSQEGGAKATWVHG